jgi:gluconokinase
LSIGTSAALRVTRDGPGIDGQCRTFCYALADGLWVQGGAVSNGGLVANWAADITRADIGVLLAEAAALPPDFDGLIALPYLLAERAPHWAPEPRAVLLGLRHDHGAAAIARALVDGVALQLAAVHESLQTAGASLATVNATGGALRAPLWPDVMAAAFDTPLTVSRGGSAGSARGAAILGWRALGAIGHLSQVPESKGEVVYPDPCIRARLTAMRDLHGLAFETATRAAPDHRGG